MLETYFDFLCEIFDFQLSPSFCRFLYNTFGLKTIWSSSCCWTEVTCNPQFAFTCLVSFEQQRPTGTDEISHMTLPCVLWCLLTLVLHSPCFWEEAVAKVAQGRGWREVKQTQAGLPALSRWFWGTGNEVSATCHAHNNWKDRVQGSFALSSCAAS